MKLYVHRLGNGFPLIILHGLYGSGDNWLTIAKSLSNQYEVFLVDQRNHGRSPHAEEHNYQALADDLLQTMDDLGLGKALILGHSMGGKAAMWFAAEHPSRISQLIVADISPRSYIQDISNTNHSILHKSLLESMMAVDFTSVSGLGDIDRQISDRIPDKRLRQFLLQNVVKDAGMGLHWRLNLPALLGNLDNLSAGLESFIAEGKVVNQFPVLFIRGGNSDFIREPDLVVIGQLFPDSQIVTIKNAGHWLHAEQPAEFISVIRKQLQNG